MCSVCVCVCMCERVCVCEGVCGWGCVCMCASDCLSVHLFFCLSFYLTICRSTCLSICLCTIPIFLSPLHSNNEVGVEQKPSFSSLICLYLLLSTVTARDSVCLFVCGLELVSSFLTMTDDHAWVMEWEWMLPGWWFSTVNVANCFVPFYRLWMQFQSLQFECSFAPF